MLIILKENEINLQFFFILLSVCHYSCIAVGVCCCCLSVQTFLCIKQYIVLKSKRFHPWGRELTWLIAVFAPLKFLRG